MTPSSYRLVERDGTLFVEEQFDSEVKPERITTYWPVWPDGLTVGAARERGLLDAPAVSDSRRSGFVVDGRVYFRLTHGGATTPVAKMTTRVAISSPRTPLPVRWRRGTWQKETKRGWIDVKGRTP